MKKVAFVAVLALASPAMGQDCRGWRCAAGEAPADDGLSLSARAVLLRDVGRAETVVLEADQSQIAVYVDGVGGWRFLGTRAASLAAAAIDDAGVITVITGEGETLEWNGQSWRQAAAPDPRLAQASRHAMAWDTARHRLVLWCAVAGGGARTFEWDGLQWTPTAVMSGDPVGWPKSMLFDRARGVMVLHEPQNGRPSTTWEYGGTDWTVRFSGAAPGMDPSFVQDPTTGGVLGMVPGGLAYRWTGSAWEPRDAWPATAGVGRFAAEPAADGRVLGLTVLGRLVECSPTQVVVHGGEEPRTVDATGVYDTARARACLVSGITWDLPALQVWDGRGWAPDSSWGFAQIYGGVMLPSPDGASFGLYEMGDNGLSRCSEWTAAGWRGRKLANGPTDARFRSPMMVADLGNHQVVVFGGDTGTVTNRMWTLSTGGDWRPITPSGTWPPARRDAAGAWDPAGRRVLMYGGGAGSGFLDDFWSWDGAAWTRLGTGSAPGMRAGAAAAYDTSRGVFVLFGGRGQVNRQDTWEWNGSWRQVSTAQSPPAGPQRMAFDPVRGVCVLPVSTASGVDVWEYDGLNWARRWTGPVPHRFFGVSFDAGSGRIVLSGDDSSPSAVGQSWAWDGTGWTRLTAEQPDAQSAAVAYDARRGRLVLFGGIIHAGTAVTSVTLSARLWEHDGQRWVLRDATGPSARSGAAMAFDPDLGRVVLTGGAGVGGAAIGDTWAWDGEAWSLLSSASPARVNASLAYDPTTRRFILLGGRDAAGGQFMPQTWEFNGSAWTRVADPPDWMLTSESARPSLAFDRRVGALLAGDKALTFRWTGGAWSLLFATPPDAPRFTYASAFDDGRGQLLRYGLAESLEHRTWVLEDWSLSVAGSPEARTIPQGSSALFEGLIRSAGPVQARWEKNGAALSDGGRISGAGTPRLRIDGVLPEDAGAYRLSGTDGCGTLATGAATLTVSCQADFNADGFLDWFDYADYVDCFERGACPPGTTADFNADGFTDFFDYGGFVDSFLVGC